MKKTVFFLIVFVFIIYPGLRAEYGLSEQGKDKMALEEAIPQAVGLKPEEEIALTPDEAIAIALRDNRDILLKAEDVKKAKLKISEAQSSFFPALNFTGSWTNTRGSYAKNTSQNSAQIGLKQYLYKGGKIINTIQYNGYNFEVAEAVLDKAKLETVLNVTNAIYTLLLAKEFNTLNKSILDNTKEHLKVIESRYKSGQASESDALRIKESLSSVEEGYEISLNQIEAILSLLRNLLYLDDKVRVQPKAQFTYEPIELAYDEGFLKAMKKRPEIRQYEAQAQANKKSIEMVKADSRPNIYASWDYYSRSHLAGATGLTKNWNDYNVIGLTFSWPIFDGWATKAKIEQAIVDAKETQLTKEKVIKDIALELKNAYLDFKDAIVQLKTKEAELALYLDNLKVVKEKYNKGIVSSLDLNDATIGFRVAEFNKAETIYNYILAKARFDKATGGM
jgi:outer membrane protein